MSLFYGIFFDHSFRHKFKFNGNFVENKENFLVNRSLFIASFFSNDTISNNIPVTFQLSKFLII